MLEIYEVFGIQTPQNIVYTKGNHSAHSPSVDKMEET